MSQGKCLCEYRWVIVHRLGKQHRRMQKKKNHGWGMSQQSKPSITEAKKIIADYAQKCSTVDEGNLYFAATQLESALDIAVAALKKIHEEDKNPYNHNINGPEKCAICIAKEALKAVGEEV